MSDFCFLFVLLCSNLESNRENNVIDSIVLARWFGCELVFFLIGLKSVSKQRFVVQPSICEKKILIKKSGSIKCRYYGDIYMYFFTIFGLVLSFSCSFSNNWKRKSAYKDHGRECTQYIMFNILLGLWLGETNTILSRIGLFSLCTFFSILMPMQKLKTCNFLYMVNSTPIVHSLKREIFGFPFPRALFGIWF